ncbi:tRNA-intron lyase [Halobacteriales archaeon QH_8_64_26]|nr:MAG: tRNA-intron lyase [Halobacteriales archaeon QH_8_64_26]
MNGSSEDGVVHVGGDARQRFHDSRGYGAPTGAGNDLYLSPVEAAHLLYRGDLDGVDGMGSRDFLAARELGVEFLVYKDLRERGFYLSPARRDWLDESIAPREDFVVYPRGLGPWDGEVRYYMRCVGERDTVPAANLGEVVLGVVDEDGDLSYFETSRVEFDGETTDGPPGGLRGRLLSDRALVSDPPADLYEQDFYGRPLEGADALGLSLVEAAFLERVGCLSIDGTGTTEATNATGATDPNAGKEPESEGSIVERGRAVEGERFDRRLAVYRALREAGVVPKTGFKFGADFRTYSHVESVDSLGHSERLVRVLPAGHVFSPRDLALDVRLAGGVRKETVFALVGSGTNGEEGIEWLSVTRLTP